MAAISSVYTIRRAAQILGRDEDLFCDLPDQLEPEDGMIQIHDINEIDTLAFPQFGMETHDAPRDHCRSG